MAESGVPLTDEERAELEALRAERAAREEAERARAERAELERLKAERARSAQEAETDRHIAEVRARNAKLMQPDDDLRMPLGQKIVLIGLVVVVIAILVMSKFGR